jgi:hypothetical protein
MRFHLQVNHQAAVTRETLLKAGMPAAQQWLRTDGFF